MSQLFIAKEHQKHSAGTNVKDYWFGLFIICSFILCEWKDTWTMLNNAKLSKINTIIDQNAQAL